MNISLEDLLAQEKSIQLSEFNEDIAWQLGAWTVEISYSKMAIVTE